MKYLNLKLSNNCLKSTTEYPVTKTFNKPTAVRHHLFYIWIYSVMQQNNCKSTVHKSIILITRLFTNHVIFEKSSNYLTTIAHKLFSKESQQLILITAVIIIVLPEHWIWLQLQFRCSCDNWFIFLHTKLLILWLQIERVHILFHIL